MEGSEAPLRHPAPVRLIERRRLVAAARAVGPARWLVAAMLVAYFALLAALGGYSQWDQLGVNARGIPVFLDLRSVTTAWECTRDGIDPLPLNPCDPYDRPANYPRIWMVPSFLGLGEGSTIVLGFLVGAIFLVAALAVLSARAGLLDAALYALLLVSPAVMLGVARANVDLVLFALVLLAVLLLRRGPRAKIAAHALLLFTAILKLFPIFAVGAFLRQRRREAIVGVGAVCVFFGAYVLLTLDDVRTIERVTPQGNAYSYGVRVFTSWLETGPTWLSAPGWDIAIVTFVVAAAFLLRHRLGRHLQTPLGRPRAQLELDLFWAGAGIYVCTYALFRSYDYRLVFLLLAVPQLLAWARARRLVAIATLLFMFATFWLATPWGGIETLYWWIVRGQNFIEGNSPFQGVPLVPEAVPQLLLFACLVAALAATLPEWLRRARV